MYTCSLASNTTDSGVSECVRACAFNRIQSAINSLYTKFDSTIKSTDSATTSVN